MLQHLAIGLAILAAVLLLVAANRTDWFARTRGRVLGLLILGVLPVLALLGAADVHMERSKETQFCLSCHVMEPYGESLFIDEPDLLAANHYQNRLVDRGRACYTCHTTYTLYGPLRSKLSGLGHLWRYYVAGFETPLRLAAPYHNRECLQCHAGARSYEESEAHADDLAALAANETSCLECHDAAHDVANLAAKARWSGGKRP